MKATLRHFLLHPTISMALVHLLLLQAVVGPGILTPTVYLKPPGEFRQLIMVQWEPGMVNVYGSTAGAR